MLMASRRATALVLLLLHRRAASFSARELRRAKAIDPARPKARQSLGQNFLVDAHLARKMANSVHPSGEGGSRVVELGPGQGALTTHLVDRFPNMTAVELDDRMIGVLRQSLPSLDVIHGDMLKLDLATIAAERGGRLSVVSNTPFYLTSPLLFKLCEATEHVESVVMTTQREVCDKILSPACALPHARLTRRRTHWHSPRAPTARSLLSRRLFFAGGARTMASSPSCFSSSADLAVSSTCLPKPFLPRPRSTQACCNWRRTRCPRASRRR